MFTSKLPEVTPETADDSAPVPSLGTACLALLRAGMTGSLVGLMTGFCLGLPFFVIGGLVGAVWGLPVGLAAGLLGAAFGGRWGWPIAGMLSGIAGGALLAISFQGFTPSNHQFGMLLTFLPGVGGFIAGNTIGKRLESPRPGAMFESLLEELDQSGLYEWPLLVRLLLAITQMIAIPAAIYVPLRLLWLR